MTDPLTRQERFAALREKPQVSVLIVGGGINGVGLLRELALQGVDALLIDRADFCAGASAASTRIIHGGLRYLENGEFRLVKESLHERNRLMQNAPHYVRPLPTTIPIFHWTAGVFHAIKTFFGMTSKPGNRGALIVKAGLTLYDLFAGRQHTLARHRFTSRTTALQQRPQLHPGIVCTATYYDARIAYPERLCLELVLDAEATHLQAKALNYVSVVEAEGDTVTLRDEVTGETLAVKPRIVVNATGAWIDFTNRALRRDTHFIGGTKGSHLVIDHRELWEATRGEMLYFANTEGRICIFYPFYDKVIAGSTDIPVDNPDTALCDDAEVDYILDSISRVFPTIKVDRSHIVYRYCGVRPLPSVNVATPGQISRDHSCPIIPPGDGVSFPIYALVGGKWTTFRAFAEQVADQLLDVLDKPRRARTENLAIGGGRGYPMSSTDREQWLETIHRKTVIALEQLNTLLDRYGTRAQEVAEFISAESDSPIQHLPTYSQREIQFIALHEKLVHFDDLILRRTLIGILGQANRELIEELAETLAPVMNWSAAQTREEVTRTANLLSVRHGVNLSSPSPAHR
jgi:glycerol-3-phosphate dehydrogenase